MGDERPAHYTQYRREFLLGAPERVVSAIQQQEHLERVSDRIAGSIIGFFATRAVGSEFHVDALRIHVAGECGIVAPDSPGRIMRAMRKRGAINYRVINRAQSRYRIITKGELS